MSLCTPLKVTADTTKRRRFQPPITTFFTSSNQNSNSGSGSENNNDNTNGQLSHFHYSAATSTATPVVPARVQSSLLSVGMRVRKSIADGYKTKGSFLATTAEDKMSLPQSQPRPLRSVYGCPVEDGEMDDIITDDGDAYSLPSSSQGSVSSSGMGRKRTFDYDDEEEYDEDEGFGSGYGGAMARDGPQIGRTILAPSLGQQRQRFIALKHNNQTTFVGAGAGGMDVDDFEEAAFLRRREDVDL